MSSSRDSTMSQQPSQNENMCSKRGLSPTPRVTGRENDCQRRTLLQSQYRLPHYAYLTCWTSHFLYAYHIRHLPYARFVRTTSLPYRYRSLSVTFVPHMIPSLLRIWYYPLFTNTYVSLYLQVYKPMYLDVEL